MVVTYSILTPDPLLSIGAVPTYTVSLNIDLPNFDVTLFGSNNYYTISNAIQASEPTPLTGLAYFDIIIFKCPDTECLECLTYNSAE